MGEADDNSNHPAPPQAKSDADADHEKIPIRTVERLPVHSSTQTAERLPLFKPASAPHVYESTAVSSPVSPEMSLQPSSCKMKWELLREAVMEKEVFIHQQLPTETILPPRTPTFARADGSAFESLSDVVSSREISFRECLLVFLLLLGIGTAAFSFVFEQWSVLDSLYFTTVMLTTVGFGDLAPVSAGGKLFAAVFALYGVLALGIVMGVMGSEIVEAEIGYSERLQSTTASVLEDAFKWRPRGGMGGSHFVYSEESGDSAPSAEVAGLCSATQDLRKNTQKWYLGRHLTALVPLLVGGAFLAHILAHRGWIDGVYFCMITATTIGFGDFAPETPTARVCAILFVPIFVGSMGYIISNVAASIVERRHKNYSKDIRSYQLKIEDIEQLDEDQDGGVSEIEYIKFMLVAMHKCDGALIDDLHDQFHRLDMTGNGKITKKDLKIMVTKKMKKVSNKLKLHQYKSWLKHRESRKRSLYF